MQILHIGTVDEARIDFANRALNKTACTFLFESVPTIRFLSVGIASEVMARDELEMFFLLGEQTSVGLLGLPLMISSRSCKQDCGVFVVVKS